MQEKTVTHNIYAPIEDAHALLISQLSRGIMAEGRRLLVIAQDYQRGQKLQHNLRFFLPHAEVMLVAEKEANFYQMTTSTPKECINQYYHLCALREARPCIIITTVPTAMKKLITPSVLQEHCLQISKGDAVCYAHLVQQLAKMGYIKTHKIRDCGEFATRGDIIDIQGNSINIGYRCEISDDKIVSIYALDTLQQIPSQEPLDHITIYPCVALFFDESENKQLEQNCTTHIGQHFLHTEVYHMLKERIVPRNAHHYLPIMYNTHLSDLFEYCSPYVTMYDDSYKATILKQEKQIYNALLQVSTIYGKIFPSPSSLYLTSSELQSKLLSSSNYLLSRYKKDQSLTH